MSLISPRPFPFPFSFPRNPRLRAGALGAVLLLSLPLARGASAADEPAVHHDPKRGFFDSSFALRLSAEPAGAEIHFTTDGSAPGPSHGDVYHGPFTVSTTTVVRSVAIADGVAGPVDTHTYVFLDDVIEQSGAPAGYPSSWNGYGADYEMDPDVTGPYAAVMRPALLQLPSLSLVVDPDDLFGDQGLYLNTEESGQLWERAASLELLYPDGRKGFQENAGIRIHGGGSRYPANAPKHSFRVYFRSEYGAKDLDFPLFGEQAADEFDQLVLRACYNNTWVHHNEAMAENQRLHAQYVRDQFIRDSQLAMGQPAPHGQNVQLYLNGLYWGIYNITERPSAAFAASYLGGKKVDYDALNSGNAVSGDTGAWSEVIALARGGLSSSSKYAQIQQFLNLDNFIDYMILNNLVGNHDWDTHNWYAARRRSAGSGFHFFSWDAEHALEDVNESRTLGYVNADMPTYVFSRLRANKEFVVRFGDRVQRHLFGGGALTPGVLGERYAAAARGIELAIVGESARWGDYRRDVHLRGGSADLYTRDGYWIPERDRLLGSYFPARTGVVQQQFRSAALYPATQAPILSQQGGSITAGFALTIANPNGAGQVYYTVNGLDPRKTGGGVSTGARVYGGAIPLGGVSVVRARVKDGSKWSALVEATFAEQDRAQGVVINELLYHPQEIAGVDGSALEFVELLNAGQTPAELGLARLSGAVDYTFPLGTQLGVGQYLVIVRDPTAFTSQFGFSPNGRFLGKLDNAGERLTLADAAGRLIDTVAYADEAPWPVATDGAGSSLELRSPALENDHPGSWGASTVALGTPGEQNSVAGDDPCAGGPPVVIAEINYNSPDGGEAGDWVELLNAGGQSVDLSQWRFQDEDQGFVLPAGTTLGPGATVVLIELEESFHSIHPNVENWIGELGFGLSGGGELLRLVSSNGCIVDEVPYDDQAPWPEQADGDGPTLLLLDPSLDNAMASSWRASSQNHGTPGRRP